MPISREALEQIVLDTCRANGIVDGYIRVVVTRGVGDLGIDPRSCSTPEHHRHRPADDALYRECRARRPGHHLVVPAAVARHAEPVDQVAQLREQRLARMEANDRDADEALMLDVNGYVAEATADNVFIVTERGLVTPPTAVTTSRASPARPSGDLRASSASAATSARSRCSRSGRPARSSSAGPARKSCRWCRWTIARSAAAASDRSPGGSSMLTRGSSDRPGRRCATTADRRRAAERPAAK